MIVGGWNYVWAAYGITWGCLLAYAAYLQRIEARMPPPALETVHDPAA